MTQRHEAPPPAQAKHTSHSRATRGLSASHDNDHRSPVTDESEQSLHAIRAALNRKALASYRQRAVIAQRLGMTASEIGALILLSRGPMTPGQLADALNFTSGGITALLHSLQRGGHVRRRADPRDRRRVFVHASPVTLGLLAELLDPIVADIDALAAQLRPREREVVATYLHQVAHISEQHIERLARGPHESEPEPDRPLLWA
jgi:DNA-binding MarR family transcriptional regulator